MTDVTTEINVRDQFVPPGPYRALVEQNDEARLLIPGQEVTQEELDASTPVDESVLELIEAHLAGKPCVVPPTKVLVFQTTGKARGWFPSEAHVRLSFVVIGKLVDYNEIGSAFHTNRVK